jgi:hypothetical protein
MKNYNLELKERITEILFRNVLWGEKKKTVYISKVVPQLLSLFSETIQKIVQDAREEK